jgi:hypothetical protein
MTQSNDVFRTMTGEEAQLLLGEMRAELRELYRQAERVAAGTLRLRPVYLGRQPWPKRCEMIRKALALRKNAEADSEILATFFMERYAKDVAELLDALGVEHDEGVLKETNPAPPAEDVMKKVVREFPAGEHAAQRAILLRAFAAQGAIDWPVLDAMVFDLEGAK